jgi:NAD(P)-dependent dehydrogenase (short-subunit alcohol dehydrogenase family)
MASYKEGMLKDGALDGKVIIITGGGTGLGKSMGTYFSKLGASLVITSRKQEVLDKTAQEIEALTGNKVLGVACDVRDYAQVENVVEQTYATFGRADVLLNNAAGNFVSPTERLSANAFDVVIDIVLKGSKNCTLAFGKKWIADKEKGKSILSIVTTYAWTGSAYVVPSAMGKAGVLAMTRSLAVEWAKYGIRCNAIAPGPFPTKGAWERLIPPGMEDQLSLENQVPLKRAGDHQELANLAGYLVSDYSAYMNGEVVTLDGGEWLQDAGEFNFLEAITEEQWDFASMMLKKVKGS